jgi:hypothetical protein
MEDVGYPKQLDYRPVGGGGGGRRRRRKRPAEPLKRPLDRYIVRQKQIIYWPNRF